ncbi:Dehydrodolichyl diphosphate synthase 2 [Bienertia sinuspersici]
MPRHVAVIMDGNARWAKQRGLNGSAGHEAGVKALRQMVELCGKWVVRGMVVSGFGWFMGGQGGRVVRGLVVVGWVVYWRGWWSVGVGGQGGWVVLGLVAVGCGWWAWWAWWARW